MMKLIGADRSFIRGPFLVEAVVYGCIAAVIATILGLVLLQASSSKLLAAGVNIDNTLALTTTYMPIVLLSMIVLGGLIGIISSLLATQRYLKL
jgi:cell division transport system permease protein